MEEVAHIPEFTNVYMANGNYWTVEGTPTTVRTYLDAAKDQDFTFCSLRSADSGNLLYVNPREVSELAQTHFERDDDGTVQHLTPVA